MKRLEAVIPSEKLRAVIDAVENAGVGGITISQSRGRGKGQRPAIETGRGTGVHIAEFNSFETLFTVVDDSKVDAVTSAITDVCSTGSKGDGKIFISTVDDTVDIGSKQKGVSSL